MGPVEVGAGVVLGGVGVDVTGVAVLGGVCVVTAGAEVTVGPGVTIGALAAACCGNNAVFRAWITPRSFTCGSRAVSPTLSQKQLLDPSKAL